MFPLQLLLLLSTDSPDAVFLEHRASIDLSLTDSSYVETTLEVVIPLTARGVRRYRSISVPYWNTWEDLEVEATIAHWRSGRGEEPASLREEAHSSLLPGNRLESSLREVHVDFPGIEVGDTLRIRVTRTIQRLPLGDCYSFSFYTGSRDSIHSASFSVTRRPGSSFHSSETGGQFIREDRTGIDGLVRTVWEAGPSEGSVSLPFSVDPAFSSPRITVSNRTPEEVSSMLYRSLVEEPMGDDGAPVSLPAGSGSDPVGMCLWVFRTIEYLGGQWGTDPGYSPRHPAATLSERAGVCREKALLLLWMLRARGYDAFPVLTSYSSPPGPLPGSRSFDHMLIAMAGDGGDTVFLDPTRPVPAPGFTYTLRGREYLPLAPRGAPVMRFPDPSWGDTLHIHVQGTLDTESSTISGNLEARFTGSADELFRSMLSSVESARMEELLSRLFGEMSGSGLTLSGDPSDLLSDLAVHGSGTWECRSVRTDDGLYLLLPGLQDMDMAGSRAVAFILPELGRELMVETPYTAVLEIALGGMAGFTGALPEGVRREGYLISVTLAGDTLLMREVLSLSPAYPDTVETSVLREACTASLTSGTRTLVLE